VANLAKTQAQWTRLLGREIGSLILAPIREFREIEDKYTLERVQVVNLGDTTSATPHITALTFTGVDQGVNTSTEGRLWARFVANGGNWDVTFYTAAGASGAVAKATNVAASATGTLVAQNSSGLAGSITLGATIAGDITDKHQVLLFVDYPARLPKVLTQIDGVDADQYSRRILSDAYAQIATKQRECISVMIRAAALYALAGKTARGNAFSSTAESALSLDVEEPDDSGNVARLRTGWLSIISDAMEDEATGGEQDVVRRVIAAAAGVFEAGNDGLGAVASHTPLQRCPIGVWSFECVAGADTGDIGRERFDGYFRATDIDGPQFTFSGLQIDQQWSGPRGFGPITLTRTKSKTNDGSNNVFAAASGAVITGETNSNTSDGDLFVSTVANGSNWDISFFSASSRHSSTLVAKATNIAASAVFTATEQNASGLTVSWTLGGTVSATVNITLELNPFSVENAGGVPDKFTVTTTLSGSAGLIQEILADEFLAHLNSDASGSESIPDNYAKQGTFVPFLTRDN